jgi:hypothetical protein
MGRIFFSAETRGFYDEDLHGTAIPPDAIEVSAEKHRALIEGQADGSEIVVDETGSPTLFNPRAGKPFVPPFVSRFQARAALLQTGYLDDIEAFMADPATDPFVRIAWQDAQEFRRNSPTVLSLQSFLGLTDGQLDDLFRFAATIEA